MLVKSGIGKAVLVGSETEIGRKVEVRRTNSSVATGSSQLFVGNTTTADVRFRFVLDSKVLPVSSQNATNLLVTYHAY